DHSAHFRGECPDRDLFGQRRAKTRLEIADLLLSSYRCFRKFTDDEVPIGVVGVETTKAFVILWVRSVDDDAGITDFACGNSRKATNELESDGECLVCVVNRRHL